MRFIVQRHHFLVTTTDEGSETILGQRRVLSPTQIFNIEFPYLLVPQLTISISKTFSNFEQIESLDLSYNRLIGGIPSELITLYNLEVFTVAHNNLSGKTPKMKGQFSTFNSSSGETTNIFATISNDVGNEHEIDITAFASSFAASYVCLLGLATILNIDLYW
ncbi:receptor-like protein 15 [Macadamia integrifolia]|uniref:receptor-like protein 15 n=1 Tax=Macadamia integrifolia TaxID=60698 RepID=UPI001C52B56C|nr:receptor-like protein 15 [Macadamia integrifolia]